jgi:hypothetical protein
MRYLTWFVGAGLAFGVATPVASQQHNTLAETAQGKLVVAFYQASRAGDAAALRGCLTGEAAKDLERPNALENLRAAMMRTAMPLVTKVTVDGTRAKVDAEYANPTRGSNPARPPSWPPDLGVTTVTGTSTYGAGPPSGSDPPASLVYPRTPSQEQQDRDAYDLATRQVQGGSAAPSVSASARAFVDHFQLVLVGTEWKIQRVERKAKGS